MSRTKLARSPETTAEMWARMIRETPARLAQFNDSLPSRDASELQAGVGGFRRASDRLGYWEGMR